MNSSIESKTSSKALRQKFLDFMAEKKHTVLHSSTLVPKEDPTVLFNSAGMQPLIPYLMGEKHPEGDRLANSQKCVRTDDIEEVGDNRHLTFFEMLGSWSLGDYWKAESISWGFEFLTSKEWLGLDPNRLFVTVYKGFEDVPEDVEAIEAWTAEFRKVGIEPDIGIEYDFKKSSQKFEVDPKIKFIYRITKKSGKDNWWGLPYRGPCGSCTEIYYLLNNNELNFEPKFATMDLAQIEEFLDSQIVEIWNHVFMEFEGEKNVDKEPIKLVPLIQKNVDTGMGFERLLTVINGLESVQDTDTLAPIQAVVKRWSKTEN